MGIEAPSTLSEKDQLLPDDLKEYLLEKKEHPSNKVIIRLGQYEPILKFYEQRIKFLLKDKRTKKNREIVRILKEFLGKYGSENVYKLLVNFFKSADDIKNSELKDRNLKLYKFSKDFSKVIKIKENDIRGIGEVYRLFVSYLEFHKRYVEKLKKEKYISERLGQVLLEEEPAKNEKPEKPEQIYVGKQLELDFSGGESDEEGLTLKTVEEPTQTGGESTQTVEETPEPIQFEEATKMGVDIPQTGGLNPQIGGEAERETKETPEKTPKTREEEIEEALEIINYELTPYENWEKILEINEEINKKWKKFIEKIKTDKIEEYYKRRYSSQDIVKKIVNQKENDTPEEIFNYLYKGNYNFKWKREYIERNGRIVTKIKMLDIDSDKAFTKIKKFMWLSNMPTEVIDTYLIPINEAIIGLKQEIEKYNDGENGGFPNQPTYDWQERMDRN